jgi:phosphoribosyl 1,2-cyclic phosphodiesterase
VATPGERQQIGDWTVLPFNAVHDAPGTLGYYIGSPDGAKMIYLTDSAYSPFTFEGLTLIAIECNFDKELMLANIARGSLPSVVAGRTLGSHMSIETVIELLKANDLSKCRQVHLLHLSDGNADAADFKRRVEQSTGVPTYIAAKRGTQ